MKRLLGTLAVGSLLVGAVAWAGADGVPARGVHQGVGIVVAVSPSEITLQEAGGPHRLTIDRTTRTLIVPEDRVGQLGIGDYVAEECVPDGKGGLKAVKLTLYRPAWMENASVEN